MAEGKEPNQSPTLTGLVSTIVITIGSVYESQDIVHAIVDGLRVIAPSAATQPVALMVFVAFIALLIVIMYGLKRHYDHLASGIYKSPINRRKRTGVKRGQRR